VDKIHFVISIKQQRNAELIDGSHACQAEISSSKLLQRKHRFELTWINIIFTENKSDMNFKSILRATLLAGTFFGIMRIASAQGYLKTYGKQIVNEKGENVLLRGVGLGGWMLQEGYMLKKNEEGQQHKIRARINDLVGPEKTEKFYEMWLANHTREIDIDSMKAWGFNSVRLPMHYNLFTLPIEKEPVAGQNTWIEKGFVLTDNLLRWCRENQMYLILDLHAAPGGQGTDMNISDRDPEKPSLWDSEANKQKTIALWRKLAERYVNEPWIGAYDIINEPNWGFEDYENDKNGLKESKNEPLKKLMVDITNAIREVDKKHIIIIEGNGWGNNYNNMLPPWDNNMVLSYHKYWNYNDEASIQHILKSRDQYNVPVWLGETGENSNVWFTQCISLLEKNNIGWAWWPLKKLGSNNPLEVKSNEGYEKILAYWNGKGPKPDAASAWKALSRVGEDLKLENNVFHKDVIDAMMRQPYSTDAVPFRRHMVQKNLTINAVDYDLGRNGKAYVDNDTANYWVAQGPRGGNKGRIYRNDGVDIGKDSTKADTYYVSNFEKGEWLQYTFFVNKAGNYAFRFNYGPGSKDVAFVASVDGKTLKENESVSLTKDKHILRVSLESGEGNLHSIEIVPSKK
jgi:endoglucanase